MRIELILRFGYGAIVPWVTPARATATLRAIAGPDMVVLRTPVRLRGEDLTTVGEFDVAQARRVPFVLTLRPVASARRRDRSTPMRRSTTTETFWTRLGVAVPRATGEWSDAVVALADHAEGADLRADRRHRRGADDVAAGAARRHRATGTIASAGCATRR